MWCWIADYPRRNEQTDIYLPLWFAIVVVTINLLIRLFRYVLRITIDSEKHMRPSTYEGEEEDEETTDEDQEHLQDQNFGNNYSCCNFCSGCISRFFFSSFDFSDTSNSNPSVSPESPSQQFHSALMEGMERRGMLHNENPFGSSTTEERRLKIISELSEADERTGRGAENALPPP
jgi:hypothetical protein